MRELLSLRRDEAPIVGEVYRHKDEFLKCVADNCSAVEGCEKCYFDAEYCRTLCNGEYQSFPLRHFERVSESEAETAADVKFRYVEETMEKLPFVGERLIATVGLVEYVKTPQYDPSVCELCDLTQHECDNADCGVGCYYKRVKQ